MWLAPTLLVALAAYLAKAGVEQRALSVGGAHVLAVVDSVDLRQRAEITRGAAYLRYTPPGESSEVVRQVELPLTYLQNLEGRIGETIPIRVSAETNQVVLGERARGQWIMTLSFAAMSLFGAAGLGWMVWSWNRLLEREGDPGERGGRRE
jgi:hypothetical protein